jgi:hypothetical protein
LIPSVAGDLTPGERMTAGHTDGPTDRIDANYLEPSPSAGADAVARILHAAAGSDHTITCTVPECSDPGERVRVIDTEGIRRRAVRCQKHAKHFLEVSS